VAGPLVELVSNRLSVGATISVRRGFEEVDAVA